MAAFAYRAVDASGGSHRGVIEAPSPGAARQMLRGRDWLPVSVSATGTTNGATARAASILPGRGGISARMLATATRQISTLVSSGIGIEEAVRLTASQAENGRLQSILLDVRGAILEGSSFTDGLRRHPKAFPEFYRASVAAGERSGNLPDVLSHLAEFVEARHRNHQKVQLALLYPALLACVSAAMMGLLLVYVVPDIVRVFVSRGAELPFLTRALIAVSAGLQAFGLYIAIAALVLGLIVRRWLGDPVNREKADAFLTRTPPFARFSRQHNAARFAGSLATLAQSSVPLVEAIRAAAAVTPNRHIRARALGIAERVREGSSLQEAMNEAAVFPSILVALVASGETSGRLAPALGRAAAELDRELEALTATIVGLVEPGVLLLMGGLVLLMVLAILLPIINLNNLVAI